jgi:YebC/PmpR family DNA-binding regulatory protein
MSGHSKWATIKRAKGVADAKRGQLFTKIAGTISIAVKQGGGSDPDMNPRLRLAIDKAKSANMPKESIERAIQRGSGGSSDSVLEELVYEGFGPAGIALIIEAVTDKKQRTVAEVKNILEKNGGSMGAQGSVAYQFDKVGEITAKTNEKSADELLDIALESGAEDVESEADVAYFYTQPTNLMQVKKALEVKGLLVEDAEIIYKPKTLIKNPEYQSKVEDLMQKLEDLDDVHRVYTNFDFSAIS